MLDISVEIWEKGGIKVIMCKNCYEIPENA